MKDQLIVNKTIFGCMIFPGNHSGFLELGGYSKKYLKNTNLLFWYKLSPNTSNWQVSIKGYKIGSKGKSVTIKHPAIFDTSTNYIYMPNSIG
jgi:hypothetical protein